jgi:DNA-binding transcriptional ArsR family regulator
VDEAQIIAEPRRREILRLVWDGERSASDIAAHFDVTFGAVSQHLKVLREADLVVLRRAGTRRLYRANRRTLAPYVQMLEQMWSRSLDRLAELAEAEESARSTESTGSAQPVPGTRREER